MAEKDIVGGIFGLTPEMYQRGLAARDTATNLAAAQLTPGQLAGYYAMEAGSGLGRAVPGLLGVEDPELVKIRDVQQMRSQFDLSTPTGLRQFASALSNKGYGDLAIQASAKAADIDKTIAEAESKRTEKIKQVGLTTDGRQVYQSGTEQFVLGPGGTKIPYYGKLESKTPKTEIKMPGELQDKELRTANVKRYVELGDDAKTSSKTLDLVDTFNKVIDTSFTGLGADAVLTAAQFANAVGATVKGTTESEIIDNILAQITLGQASKLKGALSDKDLLFLKKTVGERGLTKDTLKYVMNEIGKEAEITKGVYQKATEFRKIKGNDFADFDFVGTADEIRQGIKDRYKDKEAEAAYKKGYDQYVAKQQKLNRQPKTYDQWLTTVKQKRGEQ